MRFEIRYEKYKGFVIVLFLYVMRKGDLNLLFRKKNIVKVKFNYLMPQWHLIFWRLKILQ